MTDTKLRAKLTLERFRTEFLPYPGGKGQPKITMSAWLAAGKGSNMGFGTRMKNGATLSASQLTRGAPLLVGYLGSTRWPHVHIHAAYAPGRRNYIRFPRFDSMIMME